MRGRGQRVTSARSNPWAYLNALWAQSERQTRYTDARVDHDSCVLTDISHTHRHTHTPSDNSALLHFHLICADINKHSPGFHHLCGAFRRQNAARSNGHGKLLQLVRIHIPMSSSDPLLLLLVFSLTDAARGSITVSRVALRTVSWAARQKLWTLQRALRLDLVDNMLWMDLESWYFEDNARILSFGSFNVSRFAENLAFLKLWSVWTPFKVSLDRFLCIWTHIGFPYWFLQYIFHALLHIKIIR